MSHSKNDQVFPGETTAKTAHKIAKSISEALRQDYEELPSAIKRTGRKTGAHPRAIRNWWEGRNAPNSVHLLMLARSSPNVLRVLLELIGRADLAEYLRHDLGSILMPIPELSADKNGAIYGAKFFTINVTMNANIASQLNERQLWFLGCLQNGGGTKPADIVSTWNVTLRTARADVAGLAKRRLICFVGARKNGCYQPI